MVNKSYSLRRHESKYERSRRGRLKTGGGRPRATSLTTPLSGVIWRFGREWTGVESWCVMERAAESWANADAFWADDEDL